MTPAKIGRYEILGELGRGAMGKVYRAYDPNIGRHVAIKTIPLDPAESELGWRFRREAQAAGVLSHPNIVTVYDAGADEGFLYIAMELVEGETLQQMLARGRLPVEQAVSIAEQVASALEHAHAREIIHRDIKPANIMVQRGQAKVTDFGVAKLSAAGMTSTGQVLGTPSYLSPEVVKGGGADARSDLFSLGVILYEMLSGNRPFAGDNISTVIYRILSEQPQPLAAINPSLPSSLSYVVMKALAKEPVERYQNSAELIADLKNHPALAEGGKAPTRTASVPVPAPQPPSSTMVLDSTQLGVQAQKVETLKLARVALLRRKPVWAAVALAAVALAAVLLWQARQPSESTYTLPAADSPAATTPPASSASPAARAPAASRASPRRRGTTTSATPGPPPAQLGGARGRVVIHTQPPGARILINGERTSYHTPVNFALAPGRYSITMERDGFLSRTETVNVRGNQTVDFRIVLRATP